MGTGQIEERLAARYPGSSTIKTDRQLRKYVLDLKNEFLRRAPPLSKICFDDSIGLLHGALGLHTYASRVQGAKTKAKNELRVASLFKALPEAFLRMVVVHELSHLREKEHNKSFYQLCQHMEPDYGQIEFDLRLYLTVHGL
jgi:predicted metal-dependent hydrolase